MNFNRDQKEIINQQQRTSLETSTQETEILSFYYKNSE